jgi:hypothetical protein
MTKPCVDGKEESQSVLLTLEEEYQPTYLFGIY